MKLVCAILALVAFCEGVPTTLFGGRVVNGEDAQEGEIPYQVSLQVPYGHFCGGSIYDKSYVITAAHCVDGSSPKDMRVVAGTIDLTKPQSVHAAVRITVHPNYNPSKSWVNDIALIKVDPPFEFSETISVVGMTEQRARVESGANAVTSGWGSLRQGGPSPTRLQRTEVMVATQEYCNTTNLSAGLPIYDTQVCAHDVNVETGPCHGDSGGPLTVDGNLIGITSWVVSCASRKFPTVYTRVPEYIDWIKANTIA